MAIDLNQFKKQPIDLSQFKTNQPVDNSRFVQPREKVTLTGTAKEFGGEVLEAGKDIFGFVKEKAPEVVSGFFEGGIEGLDRAVKSPKQLKPLVTAPDGPRTTESAEKIQAAPFKFGRELIAPITGAVGGAIEPVLEPFFQTPGGQALVEDISKSNAAKLASALPEPVKEAAGLTLDVIDIAGAGGVGSRIRRKATSKIDDAILRIKTRKAKNITEKIPSKVETDQAAKLVEDALNPTKEKLKAKTRDVIAPKIGEKINNGEIPKSAIQSHAALAEFAGDKADDFAGAISDFEGSGRLVGSAEKQGAIDVIEKMKDKMYVDGGLVDDFAGNPLNKDFLVDGVPNPKLTKIVGDRILVPASPDRLAGLRLLDDYIDTIRRIEGVGNTQITKNALAKLKRAFDSDVAKKGFGSDLDLNTEIKEKLANYARRITKEDNPEYAQLLGDSHFYQSLRDVADATALRKTGQAPLGLIASKLQGTGQLTGAAIGGLAGSVLGPATAAGGAAAGAQLGKVAGRKIAQRSVSVPVLLGKAAKKTGKVQKVKQPPKQSAKLKKLLKEQEELTK